MGFNVRGFATSIKTENISVITEKLGLGTPTLVDTTYFENATSYNIGANEVFLTVASNGTILTIGDEIPFEDLPIENLSKNGKSLRFAVSETAMVFGFDLFENGKLVRTVINMEEENVHEEGEQLEIEQKESDFTEIIFSLMENVSGDSIYTLEPDIESVRYSFIADGKKTKTVTPSNETANEAPSESEVTKPWWKFW